MRVLTLTALFALTSATAGQLQISPTSVELDLRSQRSGSTVVTNTDSQTARYKVTVLRVQQNGQEQLERTTDVVVNPAVFTIAPGKRQVVRVGFAGEARKQPETAYRLLLEQQPPEAGGAPVQVTTLLAVGVPLYVRERDGQPNLNVSAERDGQNVRVTLRNSGGRRVVVIGLKVTRGDASVSLGSMIVVAGGKLDFTLKGWGGKGGSLDVEFADLDKRTHRQRLDVTAP
ncbi:fimbrial biogenesis chaperone [Deinococcus yavapaiensis]|uniref:P pilus assembly chaperone PapD n=1 Tax=Deinococcus yavapaiensis KR-236 TaxID=694435 RepID=A0A318SAF1_9DEIO|nr:fimbria/pilus periplasmic chaperone [Deinococcus yavapaiensis]PYE53231.1 P pilus assembly chaperone PapD [Deinococcus yavapaiensis KR-236]